MVIGTLIEMDLLFLPKGVQVAHDLFIILPPFDFLHYDLYTTNRGEMSSKTKNNNYGRLSFAVAVSEHINWNGIKSLALVLVCSEGCSVS